MSTVHDDRDFRRAVKQGEFARAYYFHGEDDYQKEMAVRELVASALEAATRDFNLDVVRGGELRAEGLEALLNTPPMMATRRVIVVRDVSSLRKDARQCLDRYLKNPASDVLLVLVASAGQQSDTKPEPKPDRGLLESTTAVNFHRLPDDRLRKWVRHHAQSELGAQISDAAIALLIQGMGPDLAGLAAELDKLASYTNGKAIEEETVAAVAGVKHGETLGDLLDAIADRDVSRALALVPSIISNPKLGVVPIIMALTAQTLAIAWARASGLGPGALHRELFVVLGEGRPFVGRQWKEAIDRWVLSRQSWDDASLDRALAVLLAADRAAKETRLSSDAQLLESLVLSLCGSGQRKAA